MADWHGVTASLQVADPWQKGELEQPANNPRTAYASILLEQQHDWGPQQLHMQCTAGLYRLYCQGACQPAQCICAAAEIVNDLECSESLRAVWHAES